MCPCRHTGVHACKNDDDDVLLINSPCYPEHSGHKAPPWTGVILLPLYLFLVSNLFPNQLLLTKLVSYNLTPDYKERKADGCRNGRRRLTCFAGGDGPVG
ncbi:hypothetical protein AMECASPLE_013967 [Ameca splendens]|uniref:Uncharacterized protein n=1 Tax=Ameca splendens TaxID=208324 RepID=A0ABV0YDF9_9TELE